MEIFKLLSWSASTKQFQVVALTRVPNKRVADIYTPRNGYEKRMETNDRTSFMRCP